MGKLEELEFVEALRQGDAQAFRELVSLYKKRVYNTALGILQNEGDAEDIAQEVFIAVFSAVKDFKGDSSLSTWIYRITLTRSLDHLRRSKRQKRWGLLTRIWGGSEDDKAHQVQSFHHPGVQLEQREKAAILFQAIDQLPENQRVAFTLHHVEDLSYKEIAEIMNLSLYAIESLMHRAKHNLKKKLYSYYKNEH
jgi:RNA polymerase sigma factor (sigma-70 family)